MNKDPKPLVGKSAMQSAIIYYDSRIRTAQQELDNAVASKAKWQAEINAVDGVVDCGRLALTPRRNA